MKRSLRSCSGCLRSAVLLLGRHAPRRAQPATRCGRWLTPGRRLGQRPARRRCRKPARSSAPRRPDAPRPLASNMKLFTTADRALPPRARRRGSRPRSSATGAIDAGGVLHGSLYLQGGGDPALGTPAFYNALPRRPRHQPLLPGAADPRRRDPARSPAASTPTTRSSTAAAASPTPATRPAPTSARSPASPSTPASAARPAQRLLLRPGQAGGGEAGPLAAQRRRRGAGRRSPCAPTPADAERVAVVRSPTVDQLANVDQRLLQQLLRRDADQAARRPLRRRRHHRAPAPRSSRRFARSHGSGVHAVDGSGLTRSNRASPARGGRPAAGDARRPGRRRVHPGPRPDRPGGHGRRAACDGTAAYGRCRTKTGTISGVSNLSGYCFNRSGRIMVFSILMGERRRPRPRPPRPGPDRRPRRRLLTPTSSRRPGLVEHLGAEFLGLGQLRAGALAGDDVVGFLRDRAGHLAAGGLDQGRGLLAGQLRQGAGEDDGLAFQRAALGAPFGRVRLQPQALLAQLLDQRPGRARRRATRRSARP